MIAQLPGIAIGGSGVATVNGSGAGPHITALVAPGGAFATTGLVVPITLSSVFPIEGVQLTLANGAGALVPGGVMPILGIAKVCLFGPCAAAPANISIPLSAVGVGGAQTAIGPVNITVTGAAWTTGTATIASLMQTGFRHGPASGTSSTASGSGQIQLVTPIYISTNIGSSAVIPAFAILTLHFVPEPGTMLLLAGGLAGLGAAGRRRMRASAQPGGQNR